MAARQGVWTRVIPPCFQASELKGTDTPRAIGMIRTFTALFLVFAAARLGAQNLTYDFESLQAAPLVGQDGWRNQLLIGNPASICEGSGSNSTKVLTAGPSDVQEVGRVLDLNFTFIPFTGTETQAYLQFDFSWDRPDDWNYLGFRIGRDVDNDGGPGVYEGIGARYQNGRFALEDGGGIGTMSDTRTNLGAGSVGDWFRVRLLADFTADPGGYATLSYLNLTRGDEVFTEVQSSYLFTSQNSIGAQNPSDWDMLGITINNGAQIDNLMLGVVPEPSAAAMVALFSIAGLLRRNRGRR